MPEIEEFSRYGVTFRRLAHEHIEMLRNWRNDPRISRWMGTQDHIEPEAQEKWFESIKDRDDAFYYIVYRDSMPIGCWNIKNIDWDKKVGEPGVFVVPDEDKMPPSAYEIAFCAGDLCFEMLGLEMWKASVLRDNRRAIRFNLSLGYTEAEGGKDGAKLFLLSKRAYLEVRDRLASRLHI